MGVIASQIHMSHEVIKIDCEFGFQSAAALLFGISFQSDDSQSFKNTDQADARVKFSRAQSAARAIDDCSSANTVHLGAIIRECVPSSPSDPQCIKAD